METNNKNLKKFTFNVPERIVMGSPIIGTHASNIDHTPYLLKINWLRLNWVGETGNHFLSFNIKIFFPKIKLMIEPDIFPKLANIKSRIKL